MIELILIGVFVIPIITLICIGVAEYKRMAAQEIPQHGFAPRIHDSKSGFRRSELNRITGGLIRCDKTRAQMRELSEGRRIGYHNRIKMN